MVDATGRTPPRFATLAVVSGVAVGALNFFLPALPDIARDLGASYAAASLSLAVYALATAGAQFAAGLIADRYGRRPAILGCLAIFVLATVGCALATDISTFLICRAAQAAVIAGYSVSLAILNDQHPPDQAAAQIGYLSVAWAIAPMLFPTFGGLLSDAYGWRAAFWAMAALGAAAGALSWLDLGETKPTAEGGAAAQAAGARRLLQSGLFWSYALTAAFSVGTFYVLLAAAPLAAEVAFGVGATALGMALGATTTGFVVGGLAAGRLSERVPRTVLLLSARIVASCGLAAGLALTLGGLVTPLTAFLCCWVAAFGNGLTLAGASAGAMAIRPTLAATAAGLSGALAVAGGSIAAAAVAAVLVREHALTVMFASMLAASLLSLAAAAAAHLLERNGRGAA